MYNEMIIDEKTLKETTKCVNDFECLKDENYTCRVVKVESCINKEVLFIDCKRFTCPYKVTWGNGVICSCPTRIEMYNQYKK
jgi:hypothetical protein